MKKNLSILLLCISFISCNKNKDFEYSVHDNKTLLIYDSLEISFPNTISHPDSEISSFWSKDFNSISFLSGSDNQKMSINRYEINSKTWSTIPLDKQGPNQVYSKGAFKFNQDGSFYYFPIVGSRILKINQNGIVDYDNEFSSDGLDNYFSQNKSPNILVDKNNLYFDLSEYNSLTNPKTFETSFLIGKYNLESHKLEKIINFPKEFHNKTWATNDIERTSLYHNETIYMSFTKSKYIYKYNLKGELIDQVYAGIKEVKEAKTRKDDSFTNAINQQNSGYYHSFIHDPYNDVFYRIGIYFDTDREIKTFEDLQEVAQKRVISILILNKSLQIIGRKDFVAEDRISENYFFLNNYGLFMKYYPKKETESYHFYHLKLIDKI